MTKKNPTGPRCTSTASGDMLKCTLEIGHAGHHTTAPRDRKAAQHSTWSTQPDGRVRVIAYNGKKPMGEWFEDAPKAAPTRSAARDDAEIDAEIARENEERVQRELANPSRAEERFTSGEGVLVAELLAAREAKRRKKAAKDQWAKGPKLTDKCALCGREFGEHDGKKCPKPNAAAPAPAPAPSGSGEWNCNCGGEDGELPRHMVGIRGCQQVATKCGYCDSPLDDDGVCTECGNGRTPHEIKSARAEAIAQRDIKPANLILGYERHPAAALYPLLEGDELESLASSIKANGLRERIVRVTIGGKTSILDGSNRGLACERAGVKAQFVDYEGPKDMASLVKFSLDKNSHRRHVDPSVRAMIADEAAQLGRGNPGDRETGRASGLMTQAEAGAKLGVSERLVRRARVVREKGTEKVIEAVKTGHLAVDAAEQLTKLPKAKQNAIAEKALAKKGQIKSGHVRALVRQEERRETVSRINTGQVGAVSALAGPFGLMLWDPPWEYDNSDDHAGARGHIKYPSMNIEELVALGRETLSRLKDDAVIVTWATNPRMPVAVHLIEALGLTWQSMGTWVKGKIAVAPTNMRSRTEHYIIATRGKPTHTLNELSTWLCDRPIDQTEHSRKPQELHELLEKHCAGPFLELFAQAPRAGWQVWGAQVDKFAEAA